MTETSTLAPIRRVVTVSAPVARAFQVFTEHFDVWWPRGHHLSEVALLRVTIEPGVGGRWYQTDVEGGECDWGAVLAWEPPTRLLLSWHLNGQFEYDPDPAHASEIEVTFRAVDGATTVVTVEHRYLERAVDAERAHKGISGEGGWGGILCNFVEVAEAASR